MTMVAAPGTLRPGLLLTDLETIPPAYLAEREGYNPELSELRSSFDALDLGNGASAKYGQAQWEAVLSGIGEIVAGFVAG